MATYSIYQDTPNGRVKVRNFTVRSPWTESARVVASAYHTRYPNDHRNGKLYLAMHRPGDIEGEVLEMDPPADEAVYLTEDNEYVQTREERIVDLLCELFELIREERRDRQLPV